ncbi:serine/threonine-protein kinase [Calothrix sp. PCC 7507]|uniref:serine/threonine-protein kinase n=1 Tax=Calothrix sp. PCC 7507 TaxID=99598 RepID=UPI00029F4385|nr:serine/threonine protein kinase with WD40 repeats [Calothrix sp. PCC 7507]
MNFLQNRYRLLQLIGKGGCCKTFLAVDEGQFPPIPCVIQQFSLQNQTLAAFIQKTNWLEELGQHPQIPTFLAHFHDNDHFYIVQEFISGTDLATLLVDKGPFSDTQIWELLENILPVLKFISDRHIIHRDIKPENLIYTPHSPGKLVLVDFGAAKLSNSIDQLIGETSIGSPEYIAPEQARGKAVFASDLYSLGVTCIHLLTQIPPFDLFDVANDTWTWRQYLTTKVSVRLAQILDKLLQNDLIYRFQSADEVIQAAGITNYSLYISTSLCGSNFYPSWQCIHTLSRNSGFSAEINSLAISPDGNTLVSGDDDKIIRLWDLNTKKCFASLAGHSQAVKSVAFSPDGQILATASDDQTVKLWDVNTLQEIFTLFGHSHAVKSVAFSPDGQMLASGSWDKTVKIWDINTGKEIYTLNGHRLQVTSVAFRPDGQMLASASFDRTIRLWHLPKKFKNRPDYSLLSTLSGHAWAVLTVAFSPDGQILATGSDDNTIKLWDVNTGEVITTLSGHSWAVVTLAFTADGKTLISGSWDQTIRLWQVNTGAEIATLSGHVDSVFAVAVSQVGHLIASGSRDKSIKLWQLVKSVNSEQ